MLTKLVCCTRDCVGVISYWGCNALMDRCRSNIGGSALRHCGVTPKIHHTRFPVTPPHTGKLRTCCCARQQVRNKLVTSRSNGIWETTRHNRHNGLRSTQRGNFSFVRKRRKLADGAFTVAGPAAWNVLPSDLRNSASRTVFLSNLKTHLYNRHFNSIMGF